MTRAKNPLRRSLSALLALLMVLTLVTVGPWQTAARADDEVDLAGDYDIQVWVSDMALDLTRQQIENFNAANPYGIHFNAACAPVSESVAADQMITDVESGADLFCFAQDQLARLVQADALSVLAPTLAEQVIENNDPGSVLAATSGDQLYAYPMTADNGYFMYYDKSVIPEEDVDSLERMIADCEGAGRYFAFEVNSSAWYLASWFFATGCVSEWVTDNDGKFISVNDTFNSPEGLIAVKGMKKLVDSPVHLSSSSADEFASGAAVVVSGIWDYENARGILGDNLGVTDLPSFEVDGKEYHLGSFNGCKLMGVKPQSSVEREVAVHLLALYLTSGQCQMERFEALSWGPSNLDAQASPAVQANPGLVALQLQSPYSVPQGQIHGAWWDIAKVIGDDVRDAQDEAGLQAALDNYSIKLSSLFSLTEEEQNAWSVIGSICGTNWDVDFPMTEWDTDLFVSDPLELHAGDELKVRQSGSWDVNFGADGSRDGPNLVVEEDGLYVVALILSDDSGFIQLWSVEEAPAAEESAWSVIGSICGTNWDVDFPMTEGGGCFVSDPMALYAGDELKVRQNGSWDVNFGADGFRDGINLVVEEDGIYEVVLEIWSEDAASLFLNKLGDLEPTEEPTEEPAEEPTEEPAEDTYWGVIGSICGTMWDTDFLMTEAGAGVFQSAPLELYAGDELKVRQNSSWDVNFGADGRRDGPNLVVEEDGVYVVTLILDGEYGYILLDEYFETEQEPTEPAAEPVVPVSVVTVSVGDPDEDTGYYGIVWEALSDESATCCWLTEAGSDEDYIDLVNWALSDGSDGENVMILPSWEFAPALAACATDYPDVYFVGLDITDGDLMMYGMEELPDNVYCAQYQEELGGFLAGYAAVKMGYRSLGFLGGMAVPAVERYGIGFVQGVDAAAAELGLHGVVVKYAYANQFYGDADITAAMDSWYGSGTEVVFSCGGGIFTSVGEAAAKAGGKIIGVDLDQSAMIDGLYGEGITITSAMKGIKPTVLMELARIEAGEFVPGMERLGLVSENPEENFVQLPLETTQFNETFTPEDYFELVARLLNGELIVSDDVTLPHSAFATCITLLDIGNLK